MVVLCFSVGFEVGLLEMSDWLEQPEEGGAESDDQTKGKEAEEEEQGELLASIEAESLHLETELKGLMRQYVLMLFQRERKGELTVEKKQKELNAWLGELRRARDMWLEADKDEVTVVPSLREDRTQERRTLSLFKLSKNTKERTQLLSRKIYKKERN